MVDNRSCTTYRIDRPPAGLETAAIAVDVGFPRFSTRVTAYMRSAVLKRSQPPLSRGVVQRTIMKPSTTALERPPALLAVSTAL